MLVFTEMMDLEFLEIFQDSSTPSDPHANERRKHRPKIIWFNPPHPMNVKTNIGKNLFKSFT